MTEKQPSHRTKRLTKKQVQALIKSEGKLHQEYTDFFEETRSSGYKNQPQVYELADDKFLYVFDPKGVSLAGKGDICSKELLLRRIQWHRRVRDDSANGRSNSVEHWRYYSKHKAQLTDSIDELMSELVKWLEVPPAQLDYSYKSLDMVSHKAEEYGLEKVQAEFYDNLVAYVGEVLRRRVKGSWIVREDFPGCAYPFIEANKEVLMPINVVWREIDGYKPMNLRKETANEVRRFSLRCR
jgi:hypothetical protein